MVISNGVGYGARVTGVPQFPHLEDRAYPIKPLGLLEE